MQYTIIGNTELPDPTNSIRDKCNADETYPIEVPIDFKNMALEKAKTLSMERHGKSRDGLSSQKLSQTSESQFFEAEISNPYYSGSSNITIYDTSRGGLGPNKDQTSGNDNDPNKMILHFSPKSPATYP